MGGHRGIAADCCEPCCRALLVQRFRFHELVRHLKLPPAHHPFHRRAELPVGERRGLGDGTRNPRAPEMGLIAPSGRRGLWMAPRSPVEPTCPTCPMLAPPDGEAYE